MYKYITIIILVLCVCSSCRQIYDPDVKPDQSGLVVAGLMTDQPGPYYVKLSKALPYDSSGLNPPVRSAKVTIMDDCGGSYKLEETETGTYASNPSDLIGVPGRSYTLHIETSDGNIYESASQLLLPNNYNANTYGEFTTRDILVEDFYGQVSKLTIQGIDLLVDIKNTTDTIVRFRFQPAVTTEYSYSITITPMLTYIFYCWANTALNDLVNITDEKYQISSNDILKHSICFIPTVYTYSATYRDSVSKKDSILNAPIVNRVIKVNRYCLNNESYQFYKNVNSLLAAQGKIFDPIASQFNGNIACKNNPQKIALGFFEASSVTISYYASRPGQKIIKNVPSFNLPSPFGCVGGISSEDPLASNKPPDFWIY